MIIYYLFCMIVGVHLTNYFFDFSFFINHKSSSDNSIKGSSHKRFLSPYIVVLNDFLIGIRD